MQTLELDYKYERAHYPNTVSWYRELVWLDDELVGEIRESTASSTRNKEYEVCRYKPLKVLNGIVHIAQILKTFNRVCDCKEFINNGGIL
jgi:hypothetical protein